MKRRDTDDKQQKKVKEALFVAKYMPYLALLLLAIIVDQCIRYANHWGMEISLRVIGHCGGILYCFSHWQKARCFLRDKTETPFGVCLMLMGILLMAAGPSMADMYHHKQMALFQIVAFAVLVVLLLCLGLILWEVVDLVRRKNASPKQEPRIMP